MEEKIRVGSVSYLNALPLLYGFRQGMMNDKVDLVLDYPSAIAADLVSGKIDVGLVPVAIIPELKEHYIVSDFGIGCNGEVATVCLFSDVPIEEIQEIMLDYQSRSSVALLKILLKQHWKINPRLIPAFPGYESRITAQTAGLVIGDRAFIQRKNSRYIFDLGQAWKDVTGLPFLFAAWIANRKLPPDFISAFNEVNKFGLSHLPDLVAEINYPHYDLYRYFTENIDYGIDEYKMEALKIYLSSISSDQ